MSIKTFSLPVVLSYFTVLIILSVLVFSCKNESPFFRPKPPKLTPWEKYGAALDSTGLSQSRLATTWRSVGAQALKDSVLIKSPHREQGFFRAEKPSALGYRLDLKMGELLKINLLAGQENTLLFVDLFYEELIDSIINIQPVFHAEEYQTDSLEYEIKNSGIYILRVQPELLAACRYNLDIIVQPSYSYFPVSGKGNRDVWSFFGDPRDGGRRTHKGIDIFARRGTPVVALTDGWIRRVRDQGLGGKQVWLSDTLRKQSLYYAHLDSQLVKEGVWVKAGDTLGLVGNTGNARFTPPHLHFSIYRRGYGAVDPHPFVARQNAKPSSFLGDTTFIGQWMRVRENNARLRVSPDRRSESITRLKRHLPIEILSASRGWYRVLTPEGMQGYLFGTSIQSTERPLQQLTLETHTEILNQATPSAAPVAILQATDQVSVLAQSETFKLVEYEDNSIGWMEIRE